MAPNVHRNRDKATERMGEEKERKQQKEKRKMLMVAFKEATPLGMKKKKT